MKYSEFKEQATLKQSKIMQMQQELNNEIATYKAFMKQHLGITDGEQSNVLQIAEVFEKVLAMQKEDMA